VSPEKNAERRIMIPIRENWMGGEILENQVKEGGSIHELEVLMDGGWWLGW